MSPEVRELFRDLADLPGGERERRLAEADVDDAVRQEVRQLLSHDEGASGFVNQAVRGVMDQAFEGGAFVGDTAGPYRLVGTLGQGGMGAVYLAERIDGAVSQQVAVKLVRPHAAAVPGLVDRFLRERQILASLSHPNVAQLLDAGVTSGGVPYFAMEYCDGEPIDLYCQARKSSPHEIARLFLPVCDAVAHAHLRMIVHRDLKPSNILVTGNGVPKLLDFGIAKVVDAPLTDDTRTLTRMLSIHYASPEHVRGEPVTAASDVYSLGAVLYRLLTGHYAHEAANEIDLPRAILESEPAKPRSWNGATPADLENIILMALRREPERRYASVDALADDLRRFLGSHPVRATPSSFFYRANRFIRRNPAATAASVLAVASMMGGTAFSIREARRAQQSLNDVRHMATVFLFDFEKSIRNVPGTLEARRKVIETSRGYLEKIAPQANNDPALLREVAEAYRSLAEVQNAADPSRQGARAAVDSLLKSRERRRSLGDHESRDPERLLPYIETTAAACSRSTVGGNMAVARDMCSEAMRMAELWIGREPASAEALSAADSAFRTGGLMFEAAGEMSAARQKLEKAWRASLDLTRQEPANTNFKYRILVSGQSYADLLSALRDQQAAIEPADAAAAAGADLLSTDARNLLWRTGATRALMAAGSVHRRLSQGKDPKHLHWASAYLERSLEISSETMHLDPQSNSAKDNFVVSAHRLANLRQDHRRYQAAVDLYARARTVIQNLLAQDNSQRRFLYLMGNNLLSAGSVHLAAGWLPEAAAAFEESERWIRQTLAREANDAVAQSNLVSVHYFAALVAERERKFETARARWRLSMAEAQKMIARDPATQEYIGDYKPMEEMGRRLGEWPAGK